MSSRAFTVLLLATLGIAVFVWAAVRNAVSTKDAQLCQCGHTRRENSTVLLVGGPAAGVIRVQFAAPFIEIGHAWHCRCEWCDLLRDEHDAPDEMPVIIHRYELTDRQQYTFVGSHESRPGAFDASPLRSIEAP